MSDGWSVSYLRETFRVPIERHLQKVVSGLSRNPAPSESELLKLLDRFDQVEAFRAEVGKLQLPLFDPTATLKPAHDENGHPIDRYHVLEVRGWRGYYLVDHDRKIVLGVMAIHTSDEPIASLHAALNEAAPK